MSDYMVRVSMHLKLGQTAYNPHLVRKLLACGFRVFANQCAFRVQDETERLVIPLCLTTERREIGRKLLSVRRP